MLFCGIVSGSVPSRRVDEDEVTFAFEDIAPARAPTHILIVPKRHVAAYGRRFRTTSSSAA